MFHDHEESGSSELSFKGPCSDCGSSDAKATYDDGHSFCYSCDTYTPGDKSDGASVPAGTSGSKRPSNLITDGEYVPLQKRGITAETCRKYGYQRARSGGRWVQVAPYRDDSGTVQAQHVRTSGKDFFWCGKSREALPLWGMWLYKPGKMLVITEGEIDCLTVAQLQGLKWPVVSVASGAKGAKRDIARAIEWVESFERVVIMFDMDDVGRSAAVEVAEMLTPGKACIAELPYKDANECMMAGKSQAIIQAMWNAKVYRPDGLVMVDDIFEEALTPTEMGLSWPYESLTDATYGRRPGELHVFGAGTGVGKTDVFNEIIEHTLMVHKEACATFMLETPPAETLKRLAGKVAGRRFHIPAEAGGWTTEELREGIMKLKTEGAELYLYDNFGATEWDVIKGRIKFLALSAGVRHFFIDHLTALGAAADGSEYDEIKRVVTDMAALAKTHGLYLYVISHLSTPEGKSHEEGGRVTIKQFRGSRAIGYWAHFMYGMERDQQSEDEQERITTHFRVLKDRVAGTAVGKTFDLRYDEEAGRLYEPDWQDSPAAHGFSSDKEEF